MKSIVILLIALTLILFFVAQISIQLSPFKITFGRPLFAIGWVLIIVGISCIQIDSERKGKKEVIEKLEKLTQHENTKN